MIDFAVFGLPRSGTAWVANLLTTGESLCLHDPFAAGMPETWPRDGRKLGISCTGSYLFPGWVSRLRCPVAVIVRPGRCDDPALMDALSCVDGRRWQFDDLWDEDKAADLAAFLLPGQAFDRIRYRLLRGLNVQVEMSKWNPDPSVLTEIHARGW